MPKLKQTAIYNTLEDKSAGLYIYIYIVFWLNELYRCLCNIGKIKMDIFVKMQFLKEEKNTKQGCLRKGLVFWTLLVLYRRLLQHYFTIVHSLLILDLIDYCSPLFIKAYFIFSYLETVVWSSIKTYNKNESFWKVIYW